jgi:hypothetical protein
VSEMTEALCSPRFTFKWLKIVKDQPGFAAIFCFCFMKLNVKQTAEFHVTLEKEGR